MNRFGKSIDNFLRRSASEAARRRESSEADDKYMRIGGEVATDIHDISGKREIYKQGVRSMERSGKKVPRRMRSYRPAPYRGSKR